MATQRTQRRRRLILIIGTLPLAFASFAQDEPVAETTNEAPSLELLTFLADWSDANEWIDPIELDQIMTATDARATTGADHEVESYDEHQEIKSATDHH